MPAVRAPLSAYPCVQNHARGTEIIAPGRARIVGPVQSPYISMADDAQLMRKDNRSAPNPRYVGIDPRRRSFGFAVLEGNSLLDSGVRRCDTGQFVGCLGPRFARILTTYQPDAVVVYKGSRPKQASRHQQPSVLAALGGVARRQDFPLIHVAPATIRRYFQQHGVATKTEIMQAVASWVPDLVWKLPPKRKSWQHEDHRASIFDATAAVLCHLGTFRDTDLPG